MTVQDAASGVALWRQVADGIERGIADGRFAAGERLPAEMEIAETYRVNRHTVRRALAALAERGLVRAERGSGTYVEAPRIAYPLRSRTRFSEIVGAGGIGLQLAEQIRVLEWQKVSFLILMILVAVAAIDWISSRLRFAIIGRRAVA